MDERRLESKGAYAQERAQEMADRAGTYVQDRAREMGAKVERLTGRPMESWTHDARHYVREHPLQAIALTIGIGFVLGKILGRD
ncbi:MAG TPA: DUF883 C-terminal domain-containing protein [Methylomirabilota bacterium]|jgi:ElaB/YqjD/DUF883 family membrane-anchored ribosome-binding protein